MPRDNNNQGPIPMGFMTKPRGLRKKPKLRPSIGSPNTRMRSLWPSTQEDARRTVDIVRRSEEAVASTDRALARTARNQPKVGQAMGIGQEASRTIPRHVYNDPKYIKALQKARPASRDTLHSLYRKAYNLIKTPTTTAAIKVAKPILGGVAKIIPPVTTALALYDIKKGGEFAEEYLETKAIAERSNNSYGTLSAARRTRRARFPGSQAALRKMAGLTLDSTADYEHINRKIRKETKNKFIRSNI